MRAQFEAMGLAVVVVLVSLGMFLFLFFSLDSSKAEFVGRFNNEQLSQNAVDALLKTNVADPDCSRSDVTDLIEDIVVLQRDPCGEPSEDVLDDVVRAILAETFEQQDILYNFTITADGVAVHEQATCDPEQYQTDRTGEQVLTLFPSLVKVQIELRICAAELV